MCKNTEVILCQTKGSQQCVKNEIKYRYGKKECSRQIPRSNFSLFIYLFIGSRDMQIFNALYIFYILLIFF